MVRLYPFFKIENFTIQNYYEYFFIVLFLTLKKNIIINFAIESLTLALSIIIFISYLSCHYAINAWIRYLYIYISID